MQQNRDGLIWEAPHQDNPGGLAAVPDPPDLPAVAASTPEDDWDYLWIDLGGEG